MRKTPFADVDTSEIHSFGTIFNLRFGGLIPTLRREEDIGGLGYTAA
jgi:hypothetical protein